MKRFILVPAAALGVVAACSTPASSTFNPPADAAADQVEEDLGAYNVDCGAKRACTTGVVVSGDLRTSIDGLFGAKLEMCIGGSCGSDFVSADAGAPSGGTISGGVSCTYYLTELVADGGAKHVQLFATCALPLVSCVDGTAFSLTLAGSKSVDRKVERSLLFNTSGGGCEPACRSATVVLPE